MVETNPLWPEVRRLMMESDRLRKRYGLRPKYKRIDQPVYKKGVSAKERKQVSDAMTILSHRKLKKYGKEWQKEHAKNMAKKRWDKWREEKLKALGKK